MDDRAAGSKARRRAAGDNGSRRHDDRHPHRWWPQGHHRAGLRRRVVPANPRPDETLVRAHRWKRLLEEGKYRSAAEIADAEGVTRSFVNRLLRLTLLAPDIVEAILDGRQPKSIQLEELTGAIASGWEERRKWLRASD
jgi:hypothetical protein